MSSHTHVSRDVSLKKCFDALRPSILRHNHSQVTLSRSLVSCNWLSILCVIFVRSYDEVRTRRRTGEEHKIMCVPSKISVPIFCIELRPRSTKKMTRERIIFKYQSSSIISMTIPINPNVPTIDPNRTLCSTIFLKIHFVPSFNH